MTSTMSFKGCMRVTKTKPKTKITSYDNVNVNDNLNQTSYDNVNDNDNRSRSSRVQGVQDVQDSGFKIQDSRFRIQVR